MENKKKEEQELLLSQLIAMNPDKKVDPKYLWDTDYQRLIMGMLLTDRYFLIQSLNLVKPMYFVNEAHSLICRILFKYFEEYKTLPNKTILTQELKDALKGKETALIVHHVGELNTLYEYYRDGIEARESLLHKIVTFAKVQSAQVAFYKSLAAMETTPEQEDTWATIQEMVQGALSIKRNFDTGLDYFGTVKERYVRMREEDNIKERFTIGFDAIDQGIVGGGLSKGEIGAWLGLPGVGKCHISGTKVLMYDGTIKCVENISIGDMIMGDDSTPRKVLATHRFTDYCYEIRPIKGESYFVNSHHILSLKNTHRLAQVRKARCGSRSPHPCFTNHQSKMANTNIFNISVEDWFKQSTHFKTAMKGWRTGVEWTEQPILIDPYILGVWLGDGHSNSSAFCNVYNEIIDAVYEEANARHLDVRSYRLSYFIHSKLNKLHSPGKGYSFNTLMNDLRHYDLINNKHIPYDYRINCKQVRLQLLAGLLDADGSLSNNCFYFVNKNKQLAEDVVFLARSVGLAAYMKFCTKSCQTGAVGGYWRVGISGDCSQIPTRISRKQAKPRSQIKDHLLTGIDVIPTGTREEFFGFETDGNHLFLLADFTVVHNSLALVTAAVHNVMRGKRVLYISLEMDQDKIAQRFDAQFADCPIDKLGDMESQVSSSLGEIVRDYKDKRLLVVKQFPPGECDVNTIRAYHSQMFMYGFKPELLIVDYIGEMKDTPGIPTWESRYRILRDLRGFGVEQQHCTFTALQPNRGATEVAQDGFIDESKLGDSFNQNRPLDALWTINQTLNEKMACVGRVYIAKHRNGKSRYAFKIKFDYKDRRTLRMYQIGDDQYKALLNEITVTDIPAVDKKKKKPETSIDISKYEPGKTEV